MWICVVFCFLPYLFDRVDDVVCVDALVGVVQVDGFFLRRNDGDGGNGLGQVLGVFGDGWDGSGVVGLLRWGGLVGFVVCGLLRGFPVGLMVLGRLIELLLLHLVVLLLHLIVLLLHLIVLIHHLSLLTHHFTFLLNHLTLLSPIALLLVHRFTHSLLVLVPIKVLVERLHPIPVRHSSGRYFRLPLLLLLLHPILPNPVVAVAVGRNHVGLLDGRVLHDENVGCGRLRVCSLVIILHVYPHKLLLTLLWRNVLPIPTTAEVRRRHFSSVFLVVKSRAIERSPDAVRSNSIAVESSR